MEIGMRRMDAVGRTAGEIMRGDRSARTQYNYGTALILAGRPDEAIEYRARTFVLAAGYARHDEIAGRHPPGNDVIGEQALELAAILGSKESLDGPGRKRPERGVDRREHGERPGSGKGITQAGSLNRGDEGRMLRRSDGDVDDAAARHGGAGATVGRGGCRGSGASFVSSRSLQEGPRIGRTGQGLAVTWSIIVDQHNGRLTFDTTEGEGTTFLFTLGA